MKKLNIPRVNQHYGLILKLSDKDAEFIRKLYKEGYKYNDIKEKFYPEVSICTISDIVRGKTHNRNL